MAAIGVYSTVAYFSDTDVSGTNTFTAGTLEISVSDDHNEWTSGFVLDDMKPCFTDYINFKITNDGNNPVDIIKKLVLVEEGTNFDKEHGINEPECEAYGGTWNKNASSVYECEGTYTPINDIENIINYDLFIAVYDSCDPVNPIFWQTIYVDEDNMTIGDIYGNNGSVYLGMIPVGHYMLVTQSYHMRDTGVSQNEYQSDRLGFTITIEGKQVTGSIVLEDKDYADDTWKIDTASDEKGTLTYKVKNPTFDFTFTGKAPLATTKYFLVAGPNAADPTVELGSGTTDANGDVTITDDVELAISLEDAKVWLVPEGNWNGSAVTWGGWPNMDFLWETGLIWYVDTDL
ncbi:MAG: TasA family protein [Patescibacteria group bacterium]|nr:TasA family protein [Patescibacteria group bacterium]